MDADQLRALATTLIGQLAERNAEISERDAESAPATRSLLAVTKNSNVNS
jgi:hypothetical protein